MTIPVEKSLTAVPFVREKYGSYACYPNPAATAIFFHTDYKKDVSGTVCLYNSAGYMVKSLVVHNLKRFHLDVSGLPAGIYFLKTGGPEGQNMKPVKFVVIH